MTWLISMIVAGLISAGAVDTSIDSLEIENQGLNKTAVVSTKILSEKPVEQSSSTQDRFGETYQLSPNARISLSNINGAVDIQAWDRNEARVEYVKTIDCDKPLQIDVNIDASPNSLQIETEYQNENNRNGWRGNDGYHCRESKVDYKLTVPRAAQLDEIETVNGGVTLNGVSDYAKVSTVNGRIAASNLSGTLNLSSVNGTLNIDFDNFANVREVKVSIVNGKIDLQLPSDIDAVVRAGTVHGAINNEFGLPVRKGEYVGRDLHARLGNGQVPIRLNGVNGTINVRRKQDGRQVKPVTNLLPAQNEDFDDDDDSSSVRPVRAPRPARVPRPTRAPRPPREPREPMSPEVNVLIDEETREEIQRAARESIKSARRVRIDANKVRQQARRSVEESLKSIDMQRELANAERELNRSFRVMRFPMSEREADSITVEGTPSITIEAREGDVNIRGWERSEISYALVKRGNFVSTGNAGKKSVSLQKNGSKINLNVSNDTNDYRLEVSVPKKSNIRITTGRTIRVENVKGDLKLDGANAGVEIRDAGGNLGVRTDNGNVRIVGFEGDAEIKTLGGNIALEGDFSRLNTDTATGTTILTLPDRFSGTLTTPAASSENVVFDRIEFKNKIDNSGKFTVWQIGENTSKNFKLQSASGSQIVVQRLENIRVL